MREWTGKKPGVPVVMAGTGSQPSVRFQDTISLLEVTWHHWWIISLIFSFSSYTSINHIPKNSSGERFFIIVIGHLTFCYFNCQSVPFNPLWNSGFGDIIDVSSLMYGSIIHTQKQKKTSKNKRLWPLIDSTGFVSGFRQIISNKEFWTDCDKN